MLKVTMLEAWNAKATKRKMQKLAIATEVQSLAP